MTKLTMTDEPPGPVTGIASGTKPERRTPASVYLDVRGVADLLGVEVRFVRRLVGERRMTYYKFGKFVRFDRDEVLAWVAANRVTSLR